MLDFAKKYAYNVYSQNGEDGILEEIFKRLNIKFGVAVEFGAPTKKFCSNIYNLPDSCEKYYYDDNPQEEGITKMFVTQENVNQTKFCCILSIDIDGADYEVWKAYTGKPDVVIIEINSSLPPDEEFYHPSKGSSFITMVKLGIEKGYFLLCHTGNCIFVHNKHLNKFPEIGEFDIDKYFNKSWL